MKTPLLALVLLAAPAIAFAQSAEPAPVQGDAQRNVAAQETLAERDARVDCIRYTGTRIVRKRSDKEVDVDKVGELDRDDCVSAHGRVYSQEDLRRTGKTDVADALRVLDPAIH